jgi:hypothetical protein
MIMSKEKLIFVFLADGWQATVTQGFQALSPAPPASASQEV